MKRTILGLALLLAAGSTAHGASDPPRTIEGVAPGEAAAFPDGIVAEGFPKLDAEYDDGTCATASMHRCTDFPDDVFALTLSVPKPGEPVSEMGIGFDPVGGASQERMGRPMSVLIQTPFRALTGRFLSKAEGSKAMVAIDKGVGGEESTLELPGATAAVKGGGGGTLGVIWTAR